VYLSRFGQAVRLGSMEAKPLFFAPKGFRWPWYPLFVGQVTIGDLRPNPGGMTAIAQCTINGPMQKKRVGVRLWLSPAARRRLVA